MEAPDPNPADLSPQQREARLNTVLADLRAGPSTAAGGLIVGGREAHLLWYATVDAYIAGNWVATILCGQATCERVLGGLISLNELPGAGIIGPRAGSGGGSAISSSTFGPLAGFLTTCWPRPWKCARSTSPSALASTAGSRDTGSSRRRPAPPELGSRPRGAGRTPNCRGRRAGDGDSPTAVPGWVRRRAIRCAARWTLA